MESNLNFKNFGNTPPGENGGAKPPGNPLLVRQPSVYSLTFEEFQNTWGGGPGKDFGSMNMDELLKNICAAEETQAMTSSIGVGEGSVPGGNLQRQGSLTLPRTISQKTVDEVWRDLIKDTSFTFKDGSGSVVPNLPQRQQTLGEMTLEEFLARAGVVREDQQIGNANDTGFLCELSRFNYSNDPSLALGFQQSNQMNGIVGAQASDNNNSLLAHQPPDLGLNAGAIKSSQPLQNSHQQHPQSQRLPLFPKPTTIAFTSPMHSIHNTQIGRPKDSVVGMHTSINNKLVQGGGLNAVSLGSSAATRSPVNQISPDVTVRSNEDTSSLSPVPYVLTRGRKPNTALEKVVERRQRRMIKNRESAARSRARKQAYTMELEAEIAKLKELNRELQRKQAAMEIQKNQFKETNRAWNAKRLGLRRTLTGPW
ncbi:hypothetical protein K2173_002475 [Erythroxylum novogranatense]|uniref:BZIP domain-containing protein n=1 Tax=Erythroxylum novogranatense TaxID=1862640 RepID=A0AAV8TA78_9ROSI|nr:hypothetical protein K2173_002475 [Erythroxylum novogranatense]